MPNRRGVVTAAPLLLGALLAGCAGSPKAHYYRIAPQQGAVEGSVAADIMLRSIVLPAYLNQEGVPQASDPQTLATFDNHLWAGTLSGLLQASMVRNLAQRLPQATVIGSGGAIDLPHSTIVEINVLSFAPNSAGRIDLEADVSIKPPNGARVTRHIQLESATGGIAPGQIVASMSQTWSDLANQIAHLFASTARSN